MADRVSVLVPWRGGDPDRERAWGHVQQWWAAQHPGWQVVTGACPGPWRKALAVADALTRADGELLVIADADVICEGIGAAVDAVASGSPWAIPHGKVHRLTESASRAVYAGAPLEHRLGGLAQHPYQGYEGGGMVVLTRDAHQQAPLDPRFSGWGGEDEAFALTLRTLAGEPWRGTSDLWHLHHEPQQRLNRHVGSQQSLALLVRYQMAAKAGPAAVRRLIDEFATTTVEAT